MITLEGFEDLNLAAGLSQRITFAFVEHLLGFVPLYTSI
jgi:hypothetical protein